MGLIQWKHLTQLGQGNQTQRPYVGLYGLYMVFGSGFPVPTVLNLIYGLWVWFPCPITVLNPIYGLWVRFPCPITVLNSIYGPWVQFLCRKCVESHI